MWIRFSVAVFAVLGLARGSLSCGQSTELLFYGDQHVLIDAGSRAGKEYLQRLGAGRPTPLVAQTVIEPGAALGNLKAPAQIGRYGCGSQSDKELVLCLNEQGELTYADTLSALAFASGPTDAFVPNDSVRAYFAAIIAHLPVGAARADVHISTAACAAACARQIRLERRT